MKPVAQASKLLVIFDALALHDRNSGGLRMRTILGILLQAGEKIVFASNADRGIHDEHLLPGGERTRYESELLAAGVQCILFGPEEIQQYLHRLGPELRAALVCFPNIFHAYAPVIRECAPQARLVYDMVDYHAIRLERQAEVAGDSAIRHEAMRMRELERSNIRCADLTLAVTSREKEILEQELPDAEIELLPNVFKPAAHGAKGPKNRAGILFVGGFWHAPNTDAVRWFVEEILPPVRQQEPDVELLVAGNDPGPEILGYSGKDQIRVLGYVNDLQPLYAQCRVAVAPLRFGAGMKGKVGESLNQGLPMVATALAAEGMNLRSGQDILVADDANSFAEGVVRLLRDDNLWLSLQFNGRKHIQRHFSTDALREQCLRVINPL